MNTNLTTLINEFAKNNRIGKARVEELVSKVVSNCQIVTPKKVRIPKQKIEKTSRNARRDFIKNEIETMAKNFEVFSVQNAKSCRLYVLVVDQYVIGLHGISVLKGPDVV